MYDGGVCVDVSLGVQIWDCIKWLRSCIWVLVYKAVFSVLTWVVWRCVNVCVYWLCMWILLLSHICIVLVCGHLVVVYMDVCMCTDVGIMCVNICGFVCGCMCIWGLWVWMWFCVLAVVCGQLFSDLHVDLSSPLKLIHTHTITKTHTNTCVGRLCRHSDF